MDESTSRTMSDNKNSNALGTHSAIETIFLFGNFWF